MFTVGRAFAEPVILVSKWHDLRNKFQCAVAVIQRMFEEAGDHSRELQTEDYTAKER